MEIPGLIVWLIALGMALPLAAFGSLAFPSLGVQSLLVVAGLACCALFWALDGPRWLAWASFGLALAAAAELALGARGLLSDEPRGGSVGQAAEEHAGTLAGILFPLLLTIAFMMALAGSGITTTG